jgi:ubiquinone/menaquinone biosynthesis C-methylase UbiE
MKIQKKTTKMQSGWNNWAQNSENLFHAVGRPYDDYEINNLIEDIKNKLNFNSDDVVLDVGCGSGIVLSVIKKFVREVTGIDFSEQMILLAKENNRNINFYVYQSDNMPFEDNYFNKIICYSVFHYFQDIDYAYKTIDEFLRVCKPGGKILLGDIPSKIHFKKKIPIYKRFIVNIIHGLKSSLRSINKKTQDKGIHEIYYIHKPTNWLFYNLDSLCKYVTSKSHLATILPQKENRQWNTITNDYRFDILIEKTLKS